MNWGVKIFITLLTFIIAAVSTGVYMVSQDHDSLVDDDYYEKGLSYDTEYEDKSNVQQLSMKPEFIVEGHVLKIQFKQASNKGRIKLQRTADSSQDQLVDFNISNSEYTLPLDRFQEGEWKLFLQWESRGISFLVEENMTIL